MTEASSQTCGFTMLQGIVLPWLSALVLALLPILGKLLLDELRRRNLNAEWYEAISRAGGEAYKALLASGKPVTDKAALLEAAQAGGRYLLIRKSAQVVARGHDPASLAQVAGGLVGSLLASDPTLGPAK